MSLPSSVAAVRLPSDQDASGRSLGAEELELLREVVESGILTSTKGSAVKVLEHEFAALLGSAKAVACSSGTSAVHAAIAALDPEPGEEIVTSPITDMGALTPILYQGAVPVFADVDAVTGNITADSIEAALSDRTRGIVVTHLFGLPAEMDRIVTLASKRGIPVIEDCAQAYLATSQGRPVGTIGRIGCFSLQQGKHITSGEGGLVVSDDIDLARHMELWVNKGWGYGDPDPDHRWIAPNARLTELQGAVALAQLRKLEGGVANRVALADRLSDALSSIEGLTPPAPAAGDTHTYWRYALHVDPQVIEGGPVAASAELREWTVPSAPRYIQKPAFRCGIFRDQKTFGTSRWPFSLARPEAVDYSAARFPGAFAFLDSVLVLPWSERLTTEHVDYIAEAIQTVAS